MGCDSTGKLGSSFIRHRANQCDIGRLTRENAHLEFISSPIRRCNSHFEGWAQDSISRKNKAKKWTNWPTKDLFTSI